MPDSSDGPTVLRILLGSQLRRLRESRGISVGQAAGKIRASESKISRIELGRNAVREIDILDLLTLYGVDAREREHLLSLAEQSNKPGWWHRYNDVLPDWFQAYVGMEEAAQSIRVYEGQFIPALLQTEQYATGVISLGDLPLEQAERLVVLRKERQRRFHTGSLSLWVILDEAALRRPVADLQVQLDQLRYLHQACARPNLTLQVLPYGTIGAAAPTGFSILRFAEQDLPDVIYVETLTTALYLDKQSDIDRYLLAVERLTRAALSPAATERFLDQVIRETQALPPSNLRTRQLTPGNEQRLDASSGRGVPSEPKARIRDRFPAASPAQDDSTLSVTVYLSDEVIHDQVETAVDNWLAGAGLVVEERDEPIIGSWFRRVRVGVKEAVRTPAAQDALATAAHAADTHFVLAQDAVVTATLLQGVAPVIAALQPTKDALVRAGALLIVKVDWEVQVYQLTAAQQLELNHQTRLLSSPKEIVEALQLNGPAPEIEDPSS